MARERYVNQVRLLVDILPAVAAEEEFALKGGTAINLFYRELPRLSVDVDLTFLPIKDRAQSLAEIDAAMDRIAAAGSKLRNVTSTRIAGGGGGATRVMFQRGTATVKVETSPVTRGVVFEPEFKRVSPAVEDEFGFAETRLVAFEDLFAGKLHAALDRQHPRDLFDVKLLYEHEGITDDLFRAFLVYVASSNRPPHELLNPNLSPLDDVFEKEFSGMTDDPVTVADLEAVRVRLIQDVQSRLNHNVAHFLRTLADGAPAFEAIGLASAAALPAVQWKLRNILQLRDTNPEKYAAQRTRLETLLG
ncbi:MAG: nucleotidyl transferase AbiEii/AbiGii toxin family protein [Hyphomonas sp.]|uniref:nucleotidyl transferase AbiEii/AbiGii toxin family protein n=1 Tax=Hyphomonas sp. TaxID=87 RepID=UPI00181FD1C5|nr:nucleotidyl transferase AbiEii/AbiGii toxin family protein [Hyphomonas sp.]MBA3070548.1 nucleotidyl transferase AbiEii/AbiGii toxin family protein [Hyphomonas sp.]MBU3921950.1 nucleotidyl transferase AbiEii/AbiGii toxin family protein [Alphaproteobacteria bacterium]MBU4062078.1 nucleotidyl transferase AbiEii/AbiGii toxin family protein [Alphaproteobacteria bacterium]MBU4165014.1 nucleotidyl transferase AbiEii/AbiGii toxin family protein [Alphaproteobacteria bacterium]